MDIPLYFQKVMLVWQRSIVEIDYGFFIVFGPYFIGKSLEIFKILIFGLWSFIPHPYPDFEIDFLQPPLHTHSCLSVSFSKAAIKKSKAKEIILQKILKTLKIT